MASGCGPDDTEIGYCDDFTTFLANHGAGIDGSDIYTVTFSGSDANLTHLTNVAYETHIAFNAIEGTLLLVNVDGSSIDFYDVATSTFTGNLPIIGSFTKLTTAVFNPVDELLYVGDHHLDQIHTIDLATGVATYYADGPVSGGDLEVIGEDVYLATKHANGQLYKINEGAAATLIGSIPANVTGIARANDEDNSFITSNNGASGFSKISAADGSVIGFYNAKLGGVPFTLTDGDMAAGCADVNPDVPSTGECSATEVIEFIQGTKKNGSAIPANRSDANKALGMPERTDQMVFVSLGYGGSLTLAFDGSIPNGPGADIEIVETSFNTTTCAQYKEYADVYVSQDGDNWFFAKTVCKFDGFVDISDAGDFDYVNYVRIVNNDELTKTPDGFDVDGVVAIYNCEVPGPEVHNPNPPVSNITAVEGSATLSAYPNPTEGPSNVVFKTAETTRVLLEVYDMSGRNVATLFDQEAQQDKEYKLDFNGSKLPNGVYVYRLTTNNETIIEKFMIAK